MKPYFIDMNLSFKEVISLSVLLVTASFSLAEEVSPYKPSFFLSPYQVEWDSNIDNIRTNYTINSPVLKNSANSINNNYVQKFSIGLPNNFALSISDLYVQSVISNPLNVNAAKPGFKNPVVSAAKLWSINDQVLVKVLGSVQPNLGGKAGFTTYNLGASVIYIGSDGWEASFGVNQATNDAGYGGAPSVLTTVSKQVGLYVINTSAGATRFPSIATTTGYAASSYLFTGGLDISHQLSHQVWAGVNYNIGSNQYIYTQNLGKIPFNNRTLYNTVGVSLKVLF
jgi:hypothetical protein